MASKLKKCFGENVEQTIINIGRMGREGMRATDNEILNVMSGNETVKIGWIRSDPPDFVYHHRFLVPNRPRMICLPNSRPMVLAVELMVLFTAFSRVL